MSAFITIAADDDKSQPSGCLLDPDIWMGKDLIIRKVCAQMGLPDVTDDFYYKFSPYRSYLTLNLWHIYNLQNHVYDDMFFIPESVPATPFKG
ncbi:hypothetical protein ABV636_004263 [Salmonella enterica]